MKLLYKELALAAHPTSIVYPYTVIFMFGCLAPYLTFQYARETNDLWYTGILPFSLYPGKKVSRGNTC